MANSTLTDQVSLYANRLSIKEADNNVLQTAIKNLQVEVKNLKAEVANIKKSDHSGGTGAANKDNNIMSLRWKQEGQTDQPTWWSTTYCWSHGPGVHLGEDFKNRRAVHKAEDTERTGIIGSKFG